MTIPFAQSLTVEFISDRHDGLSDGLSDSKVVDAVVGMANVDGGLIFLGVSDDGTPEGLSDPTSRWLKAEAARAVIFERPIRAFRWAGKSRICRAGAPSL